MKWRLGIDLGTNSLGWWAFQVKRDGQRWRVQKSLDGGVYIFPEGREPSKRGRVGDSNAVQRRLARSMRRNRDRRKTRLRAFIRELVHLELMPEYGEKRDKLFQAPAMAADPDRYNPYRLRAEGLERTLEPYELGRALFHLGLRRGFKSNRIESSDEDGGNLKERIDDLAYALGEKTLGQFLWDRLKAEREDLKFGEKPKGIRFRGSEEFYPSRSMYAEEFDAICHRQTQHHSLTTEDWERLRNRYVLFQWPLKPVERGACQFFPEEQRHWRDTPIGHDYRIYQELNSLRWFDSDFKEHSLDAEQYSVVLHLLMTRKSEVKFASMRKQKRVDGSLLFPECIRFNLEDEKRKGLKNHSIAKALSGSPALLPFWRQRCEQEGDGGVLDDIFMALQEESDPETLRARLVADFSLEKDALEAFEKLRLSRTTASVSRRFMEAIVPVMRDQHLMFWEAVRELTDEEGKSLHHSQKFERSDYEMLPYYGEILRGSTLGADSSVDPDNQPELHYGKISNPTVHVALNSLRRVLNGLIERFGEPPVEIHVELSRDLKRTRKKRDETTIRQAKEKRENDSIREMLEEHGIRVPSGRDIKKVKLWEELGKNDLARCCPFSGKPISCAQLLNGEAEIEHILPFKRTLDDSMSNLTVAMRWANRLKGNRTPYEAFAADAHAENGIFWESVAARAKCLPSHKVWRFGPDAMERFTAKNDFLARQLTDNAYIARCAVRYLSCLKGVEQIVPNRGGLTALLRGKWQLNRILSDDNRKHRGDHRHHAVDAAVIALADRSILKCVSDMTSRGADDRIHIMVPDLPANIEKAIHSHVPKIVVVFKPDHSWQGQMFKETAYRFVEPDRRDPEFPEHNLVVRKPLADLRPTECAAIRDPLIRAAVSSCLENADDTGETHQKTLTRFAQEQGIRSVRILIKDQTAKPIPSAPYKYYVPYSYVCCDVWQLPKGKPGHWKPNEYTWKGFYWSYADVSGGIPSASVKKPHPAAKFIARLFKNDMIAYKDGSEIQIMRVAGFSTTNNKLDVVPHFVADPKQQYVSINTLGAKGIRKLQITADGRVRGYQL